jgi:hypothetical protein
MYKTMNYYQILSVRVYECLVSGRRDEMWNDFCSGRTDKCVRGSLVGFINEWMDVFTEKLVNG